MSTTHYLSNLTTTMETEAEPLVQAILRREQVFGRKYQALALKEAYQRICCPTVGGGSQARKPELVLLTGASGTGKTTLAHYLKQHVALHGGIFVRGKYDRLHRKNQTPFGGFVGALTDYANQITAEGIDSVQAIRDLLRANKNVDINLLVDMVPSLEELLLEESADDRLVSPVDENGSIVLSDSQRRRFRFSFTEFIGVLSTYRPIVIFLDDLQWCDRDSLGLLVALAVQAHTTGVMLLGACRGNEVAISDPLSECLRTVEGTGALITDIFLQCLDAPMVHELLSISLRLGKEECTQLADVVFRQTGGNFFYLTHFTNALQLDRALYYDDEEGTWKWDGKSFRSCRVAALSS